MYVLLQNSKRICFTLLVQVDLLSFPELHKEKHKEKHLLPTIVLSAGASPVRDFASCPLLSTNIPEETTAVGMKSAKQQRRQAEVWVVGLFCLPLSNSLLEFCQLNNHALLSTLMEARLEKKVSGPWLEDFWVRSQETWPHLLCQLSQLLVQFSWLHNGWTGLIPTFITTTKHEPKRRRKNKQGNDYDTKMQCPGQWGFQENFLLSSTDLVTPPVIKDTLQTKWKQIPSLNYLSPVTCASFTKFLLIN